MKLKYFTQYEVEGLSSRLSLMLDQMRDEAETPIIITSGFRTKAENNSTGGESDSAHLEGLAVDIRCGDSVTRCRFLIAALKVGFRRIGLYDKHIHVDIDEKKPQNVIWIGKSK